MFYDFSVKDMKGENIHLKQYEGKVLLVVNTATACGFTPQYTGLQKIYEKFRDKGFEILDFPCNQFAEQAKGSDSDIASFCTGRFGITFKQFSKIEVNGDNEEPLYTFLKKEKRGIGNPKIKWNFTKFLVDKNGNVVKRYGSVVKPEKIVKDILKLLLK